MSKCLTIIFIQHCVGPGSVLYVMMFLNFVHHLRYGAEKGLLIFLENVLKLVVIHIHVYFFKLFHGLLSELMCKNIVLNFPANSAFFTALFIALHLTW